MNMERAKKAKRTTPCLAWKLTNGLFFEVIKEIRTKIFKYDNKAITVVQLNFLIFIFFTPPEIDFTLSKLSFIITFQI